MLDFIVEGKVKPKQSFRFSRFGCKYTPADVKEYARNIQRSFYAKYPKWDLETFKDTPLKVEIDVFMQIPKATSKKNKERMLEHDLRPLKRPDIDNVAKNILDALNGIVYADDKQIVELAVKKYYAERDFIHIVIDTEG